ncbi:hypothetical protein DFJ74DRAFT_770670 [Hyaloraphidium curvatum]|nr:hypothetical protein DFJ74DRAFT_770670 [Hyaloraphidium curvatum]
MDSLCRAVRALATACLLAALTAIGLTCCPAAPGPDSDPEAAEPLRKSPTPGSSPQRGRVAAGTADAPDAPAQPGANSPPHPALPPPIRTELPAGRSRSLPPPDSGGTLSPGASPSPGPAEAAAAHGEEPEHIWDHTGGTTLGQPAKKKRRPRPQTPLPPLPSTGSGESKPKKGKKAGKGGAKGEEGAAGPA